MNESGMICGNWAQEEIYKVGLITIYHHWEKSINKLLKEQALKNDLSLIKNKGRLPLVMHIRKNLEEVFECIVDDELWRGLDEAREVVNCYKHGTSEKFEALYKKYPYYFIHLKEIDDVDYSEHFILGEKNLERLSDNILSFWEVLPRETNLF